MNKNNKFLLCLFNLKYNTILSDIREKKIEKKKGIIHQHQAMPYQFTKVRKTNVILIHPIIELHDHILQKQISYITYIKTSIALPDIDESYLIVHKRSF